MPAISVARSDHDPLQRVVTAWIHCAHRNPWLARSLLHLFSDLSLDRCTFVDMPSSTTAATSTSSILDRGLSAGVAAGTIGQATADALREEAQARRRNGTFLGQIPYLSVVARRAR